MDRAYVMVRDRLKNAIKEIEGVEDAYIVAGDIDVIAFVEVDEPVGVKMIVADGIQGISGVEDTRTYIAME